jgi:hypothetical protein
VKDELPLALIEEQAEGEVSAEQRGESSEGDGFDEPDGADYLVSNGRLFGSLAWLGGGAGHEKFFVDFSTLERSELCGQEEALT